MITREAGRSSTGRNAATFDQARNKPLGLYTESIMSILTSHNAHSAFGDLVSLMGQTFPLASPAIYTGTQGLELHAYSVLEGKDGGDYDALRVLKSERYSYSRVLAGGQAPYNPLRVDFSLMSSPQIQVVLSINPGVHEGIFRDWVNYLTPAITKLLDNEFLLNMAFRDGLTGLLNYRAFSETLMAEWDRARRYKTTFSLMMIDIDHFKRVNDEHGHQAGDMVLSSLANRLQSRLRKSDLVFRYGGEEFMILLPQTGIYKASPLAERIRVVVEKTRFPGNLAVTISIGISQYRDGLTPSDLVKQVDTGLYLAKGKGRNRVEIYKDIASL
ncbi:MAG TPA: GGDEF domain-containing protein [Desulfomonilia bacterium]|nr:GGDEF domain-containing protein [Desulfomonilia bacterium]